MAKTLAYLRVSTDKQDVDGQRLELLDYARTQGLSIDDFIEATLSSRASRRERRIDDLVTQLQPGDTLMVTELSRLGRSTVEVIALINTLLTNQVRVIVKKQGLDIRNHDMQSKVMVTLFSLFAELERDLISARTKEALAAKKQQGVTLGKPKGTIQKSKFDADRERIDELLALGLSVRKIAKVLGYPNHVNLNTYLKKRSVSGKTPSGTEK